MVILLLIVFLVGYISIALESGIGINKAATALITGVICWTVYIGWSEDKHLVAEQLTGHLGELSGILFFLLGAMTIVELIDVHDGFNLITDRINQTNKRKLIWIISFITFFLSALLDNLTTTIVMISLIRKLISERRERLFFAGLIIIAANAGGCMVTHWRYNHYDALDRRADYYIQHHHQPVLSGRRLPGDTPAYRDIWIERRCDAAQNGQRHHEKC